MVSKSDYLPKDNTVTELQATRACLALRDLLSAHVDLLLRHLPPKDARCVRVCVYGSLVWDVLPSCGPSTRSESRD